MATNRLEKLRARRTDPLIKAAAEIREVYDQIAEDEPIKYVIGAMQPIDAEYTKNTFAEGDRVKAQLDRGLSIRVHFEYQGSVTNNTHIKVHSDLDLLTLHGGFHTIEPPGQATNPYQGNVISDLKSLRNSCALLLKCAYPTANVDDKPGKSISIEGGSLRRKIDVVVSNWWDTAEFQRTGLSYYRGVQVFDSEANETIKNKPFLHNERIDQRDRQLNGNVRKVARLLKSLKYDAETRVDISSYDIAALAYRMPAELMYPQKGAEPLLLENTRLFLRKLIDDSASRNSLQVPNEMRAIFCDVGASLSGLQQLYGEVERLVNEIANGLSRSFRKLADARVAY